MVRPVVTAEFSDQMLGPACALPGRFRAVVTVAASFDPQVGCNRTRIVAVRGDADPVDAYRGGPDRRRGYPTIPPAATAIAA
jgi:poly(3-hydroxybutyrate) depolymerase